MAILATPMGTIQPRPDSAPGILTIDLNRWKTLVVRYGAHDIEIPAAVIFAELTKANDV